MMMKKLLICLSLNLLSITPIMAFYVDNINYAITSDTTVEVTSPQNSLPLNVVIPEQITYEGKLYTVTSIGDEAFDGCSSLSSIEIPNSVTSIGYQAFYSCDNLISITIPNSVTSIGSWAFRSCSKLTSVTIGNSVTSIGSDAFISCSSLISIEIPNSVTSIGYRAFNDCDNLTSVVVESGNTIYDSRDNCNAIIETASNTLIAGCQNTIIPNSVTSIGDWAFRSCSKLTSVTIPNSVTSIGDEAFNGCYSLSSIEIPNSVTSIGSEAFSDCDKLTSVTIGNGVTSIGSEAFSSCSKLTSVTIGNGVMSIGDYAFSYCSSLRSIEIPNSVTSIGREAFSDCDNLTSVVVESGNTIYDSRDNCNAIIETASNTLIAGCQNTIIPNSVTSIGNNAFSLCSSLTSIEIPGSVTSIGSEAFISCSKLTSVTIGNGVMSIGDYAFSYCSSLRSIEIPNSVTSIGYRAFSYCSSLRLIEIPNSVTSIGREAFYLCDSLSSVYCAARIPPTLEGDFSNKIIDTLYVLAGFVETYKQSPWAGYFLNIIEDGDADVVDVTTTSATLLWSSSPSVKYYVINVYKEDAPYAEFIVDDKGVILSETYEDGTSRVSTTRDLARLNVPIKKMGTDTTTNNTEYFVIQLDGLQSGTQYSYTVRGMNAKDECIYEETVQFTTLTMSAITEIFMDDQEKYTPTKILHRGNLYILHPDGSLYDMKGTKVNLKNITVR